MKRLLLAGVSAIALAAGARQALRVRKAGAAPLADWAVEKADEGERTAKTVRHFLMFFVVPVWIGAGIADWACHRASDVEHTGGPEESLLHLLMLAEVGVPSLAGLLLEVTSPVFALMIAAFVVHQATALWDVAYAVSVREVSPVEQQVHSFLELMPLMAIGFLAVTHDREFLALFGLNDGPPERGLKLKREPLPAPYLASAIGSIVLFNLLPYLEELWRGLRARRSDEGRGTRR